MQKYYLSILYNLNFLKWPIFSKNMLQFGFCCVKTHSKHSQTTSRFWIFLQIKHVSILNQYKQNVTNLQVPYFHASSGLTLGNVICFDNAPSPFCLTFCHFCHLQMSENGGYDDDAQVNGYVGFPYAGN